MWGGVVHSGVRPLSDTCGGKEEEWLSHHHVPVWHAEESENWNLSFQAIMKVYLSRSGDETFVCKLDYNFKYLDTRYVGLCCILALGPTNVRGGHTSQIFRTLHPSLSMTGITGLHPLGSVLGIRLHIRWMMYEWLYCHTPSRAEA